MSGDRFTTQLELRSATHNGASSGTPPHNNTHLPQKEKEKKERAVKEGKHLPVTPILHDDVTGLVRDAGLLQGLDVTLDEGDVGLLVAKLLHVVVDVRPGHLQLEPQREQSENSQNSQRPIEENSQRTVRDP